MTKKNYAYGGKAAAVLEWLNTEPSATDKHIAKHVQCSPSYVHKLRKEMVHVPQEEEPKPEPKKESLAEKLMRQTKEWADANATNVDAILDKRAEQYGSFMASANVAIRLKGVMHNAIAQQDLHLAPDQLLALDMIAVKVSRILTGNPSHLDSWLDIAGYAKLVADRLQGNGR
jgi:primosomal protein N'